MAYLDTKIMILTALALCCAFIADARLPQVFVDEIHPDLMRPRIAKVCAIRVPTQAKRMPSACAMPMCNWMLRSSTVPAMKVPKG